LPLKIATAKAICKLCEISFDYDSLIEAKDTILQLPISNSCVERMSFLYISEFLFNGFSKRFIIQHFWKPFINLSLDKNWRIRKLFISTLGKLHIYFNAEDEAIFDIKEASDRLLKDSNPYVSEAAMKNKFKGPNQSIELFLETEEFKHISHEAKLEEANKNRAQFQLIKIIPKITNSSPNVLKNTHLKKEIGKVNSKKSDPNITSNLSDEKFKIVKPKKLPEKSVST